MSSEPAGSARRTPARSRRLLPAALALGVLALPGCGKKGDPMPPPKTIPQAVTDLTLRQRGDHVLLEFTHPKATVAGLAFAGLDRVTLYELDKPVPTAPAATAAATAAPAAETATTTPATAATSATATTPAATTTPPAAATPAQATAPAAATAPATGTAPVTTPAPAAPAQAPAGPATATAPAAPPGTTAPGAPAAKPTAPPVTVQPAELAGAKSVLDLAGADLATAIVGDRIRLDVALPSPLPEPPVARAYAVRTKAAGGGLSDWSNVAVLVPGTPPPAPAEITVEARKEGVDVSWQAVESAKAGYSILRRTADRTDWGAPLTTVDAGVTDWMDRSARYGTRYVYTVLALAARTPDVESAPQSEREVDYQDRFPPAIPRGLRALALPGEVRLLWEASSDPDVAGYRLERAGAEGDFAAVGKELVTGLEYTDGGLPADTVFRYRVVAVDQNGNASPPSRSVEVRLP